MAIASTCLIPNGRRIVYECFKPRVLAQRIPERRVAKIARVNSRWDLKQVRNGSNRCIDFAETRLDLRAVAFGDWFD